MRKTDRLYMRSAPEADNEYDPRIILQVVPPDIESYLTELPGEELLSWKNVLLKRLDIKEMLHQLYEEDTLENTLEDTLENDLEDVLEEDAEPLDMNVTIWQLTDTKPPNTKGRSLDPSLFCPQLDAFLIFHDVKEPGPLREWLTASTYDIRLRDLHPFIIGTYRRGESTCHFEKLFGNKEGVFLWELGDTEHLAHIYREILDFL